MIDDRWTIRPRRLLTCWLLLPAAILIVQEPPPPNHDCENMDMPAVVTPSVNVTDMACV
eukprot:SAG25_NODE_5632_length_636_cov_1.288641_2_plen_58_part_01